MILKGSKFIHSLWAVILCSLSFSAIGQSQRLDLYTAEMTPHSYYTYSSLLVEDEIDVLEENNRRLSIEDILQGATDWKDNDPNTEPDQDKVYWAHVELYSNKVDRVGRFD